MIRRSADNRYTAYVIRTEYGRKYGYEFSVRKGSNRIECYNRYAFYRTNACIDNGLVLPDEIPPFESFIQACIYAKQNAEALR